MLDVTRDPIEVAPTAHYSMGGVWVRPEDHSTDVDGLFVIGEAASGLHGANRLGGNSLIELLVYGRLAGQAAAEYSAGLSAQRRSLAAVAQARTHRRRLLAADGADNVRALQRTMRNLMTEHAGVVRDEAGLARRACLARAARGADDRRSASHPTSPATRTSPTPSTSSPRHWPPARRWSARWSGARPGAATTAPTTRSSTPTSRSILCGPR